MRLSAFLRAVSFAAVGAAALFAANGAQAVTSAAGAATFAGDAYGMRVKAQNGEGHYVGVADLGVGANRTQSSNKLVAGSVAFSLSYTAASGLLSSTYNGTTINFSAPTGLSFDTVQVLVDDRRNGGQGVSVTDLIVQGDAVAGTFGVLGASTFYTLSGLSALTDFMMTGTIIGANSGNEAAKVEFLAGSAAPVPLPAGAWLLVSGFAAAFGARKLAARAA